MAGDGLENSQASKVHVIPKSNGCDRKLIIGLSFPGGYAVNGAEMKELEKQQDQQHWEVVVIGAGQAGLAIGYYLAQAGRRFVILDAGQRIGDAWRQRWDSLRLFTPAAYDSLPGMPFPT